MSVRTVGWTVSLGVAIAGAGFAAATALADDDTRRKALDSARLLRDRAAASLVHLREQGLQSAGELRDQWTETALEVRDRWSSTAEDLRARAVDTAGDWRDRSNEGIERALQQAAEVRDDSLATLPDDDDDPDGSAS